MYIGLNMVPFRLASIQFLKLSMASNSVSLPVISSMGGQKNIVLPQALQSLLKAVINLEQITTYKEVLDGLKSYIWQNKLCDISTPGLIQCKNDELGSIFGVSHFMLKDITKLLYKALHPDFSSDSLEDVTSKSSGSDSSKRKLDHADDELTIEIPKKLCLQSFTEPPSPMYLQIPSPIEYHSSSESSMSMQGYETMFAKDTSDDLWYLEDRDSESLSDGRNDFIEIQEMYNVEYDVESASSDNDEISVTDSEVDDIQNVLEVAILSFACKTDSDVEFWADQSSDEDLGFDAEISEFDQWKCNKCGSLNEPPMRFCLRCWDQRVGWMPERSERRLPRRQKRRFMKNKSNLLSIEWKDSSYCSATENACSSQDSGVPNSSLELTNSQERENDVKFPKQSNGVEENIKVCSICCERPLDGSIIHGPVSLQLGLECFELVA